MTRLTIGSRVISKAVGAVPAFSGVIVAGEARPLGTKFEEQFTVRDQNGAEWVRSRADLQSVK